MTEETTTKTWDDYKALCQKKSWQLMTKEARAELIRTVIFPDYNKVTSDGVRLGPTAWADLLGTNANTIEHRVRALRTRKKPTPHYDTPEGRAVSRGRAALRDPAVAKRVLKDPKVIQSLKASDDPDARAVAAHAEDKKSLTKKEERREALRHRAATAGDSDDIVDLEEAYKEAVRNLSQATHLVEKSATLLSPHDSRHLTDLLRSTFESTLRHFEEMATVYPKFFREWFESPGLVASIEDFLTSHGGEHRGDGHDR